MRDDILVPVPPSVPRSRDSAAARWLGRTVLRLGGWRVVGALPDVPRLVVIAAPHSTNWDGVWGFAAKLALGIDVHVLGKASLFRIPLLGRLLRTLGVVPVDRASPAGVVEQAAALILGSERLWYALAPEGTRRRVEHWKPGFWKIARAAGVPVLRAYFHYPERIIGFGPLFHPTDDFASDMAELRAWYRPWQGRNRGTL
jgi:1-acyl-sn-glycerol-3-phosphate acyltransferase